MKFLKFIFCQKFTLVTILLLISAYFAATQNAPAQSTQLSDGSLLIGIIADCQFADQPAVGVRQYSLSDKKLEKCVDHFNSKDLDHVFHLGDFIDQKMESFDIVEPIINRLKAPFTLVLGNHDFSVSDEFKTKIPEILGLEKRYFTIKLKGWKFIILDGNDISLYAWPTGSKENDESHQIYREKYENQESYNGALGDNQLAWLQEELEYAEKNSESVILLCHFPILPVDAHVLWNSKQVLDLISSYQSVKAWFNGHNHAGDYVEYDGIHFLTFRGMVDTEENSYATVVLENDQLLISGIGREENRNLIIRK
tara:strand:- start:270 stop:1202 length:933 start_codon:yes stop_codon:yes gene_type:complete